jgi:hypothetical protein
VKLIPAALRRRLAERHRSPWPVGELETFTAQADWSHNVPRQGPPPPPDGPARPKASWSLRDRQNDPALGEWRPVPRPDSTPRIWDSLPHS